MINNHIDDLFTLSYLTPLLFLDNDSNNYFDTKPLETDLVQNNTRIVDWHRNWNILLFKEAIKMKEIPPSLNSGLKASKDLQLFSNDSVSLKHSLFRVNNIDT